MNITKVDYGNSSLGKAVEAFFAQGSGKLRQEPAAQAVFLIGACCSRIEWIQGDARKSTPFAAELNGFRLTETQVRNLLWKAKAKSVAYGSEYEGRVAGLIECAGRAAAVADGRWNLSPDEISYYCALGHALNRLLKTPEETNETHKST